MCEVYKGAGCLCMCWGGACTVVGFCDCWRINGRHVMLASAAHRRPVHPAEPLVRDSQRAAHLGGGGRNSAVSASGHSAGSEGGPLLQHCRPGGGQGLHGLLQECRRVRECMHNVWQ